jgi:hypothetical protein
MACDAVHAGIPVSSPITGELITHVRITSPDEASAAIGPRSRSTRRACSRAHVHIRGSFGAVRRNHTTSFKWHGHEPFYVHVLFDNLTGSIQFVRSGAMRALGVTTTQRWGSVPDIPAIAETVPGYEATVWYGIVAPKGTPSEIVARLNKAVNAALADANLVTRFADTGGLPMPMDPSELGKLIADETEKWRKVVEFAGVSAD